MDGNVIDVVCDKLQWLLDHPEVTWSGIGIYALSLIGGIVFRKKKKSQGNHATSKLVKNHGPVISTSGDHSPAVNAQGDVTIIDGVPFEKYDQVRDECERLKIKDGISDAAFASFFKILEQESIPCSDWGVKLAEIAFRYKDLLLRFEAVTSDDLQVQALKEQAQQAFKNGEYDRADNLLDQIDERRNNAIHQLHKLQTDTAVRLEQEQLGKAENLVSRAKLQRLQYRYEKAAQYLQEAAAALPEGRKKEWSVYLGAAGEDLHRIAHYADALRLFKQSLFIFREISDRKSEAMLLNSISQVYKAQGDYGKALDYLEQSLSIHREVGNKEGKGTTMNNIATIYLAKGDCQNALKYLEQSLLLQSEIGNKEGEGWSLNNIGMIHYAQGDYAAALDYYEQALPIAREIEDKKGESTYLNNIGAVYHTQNNYDAALEQYKQSLTIIKQICDRRNEGRCLNNIAAIYEAKGDYTAALKQCEQSLAIAKEIDDKDGEASCRWNIGVFYMKQGELAKAEPYISRAVELGTQLERPDLETWREALELVRAKLRGQQK